MEVNDHTQNTKKLNYHKSSKSSTISNDHYNNKIISTSPTHEKKPIIYHNQTSYNNNPHCLSDPKDDQFSQDSFEHEVQSTVQAITDYSPKKIPMETYLDKTNSFLQTLHSSIQYFNTQRDFQKKEIIKDQLHQINEIQALEHQIQQETFRNKDLQNKLYQLKTYGNASSSTLTLMDPNKDHDKFARFMRDKIAKITHENNDLKKEIEKGNRSSSMSNLKKYEQIIQKEIKRLRIIMCQLNNDHIGITADTQSYNGYIQDKDEDDPGKMIMTESFDVYNDSQEGLKGNTEINVQTENKKKEPLPKPYAKNVNKTSENSLEHINRREYPQHYGGIIANSNKTNGGIKPHHVKGNSYGGGMTGSANGKSSNVIPRKINKK